MAASGHQQQNGQVIGLGGMGGMESDTETKLFVVKKTGDSQGITALISRQLQGIFSNIFCNFYLRKPKKLRKSKLKKDGPSGFAGVEIKFQTKDINVKLLNSVKSYTIPLNFHVALSREYGTDFSRFVRLYYVQLCRSIFVHKLYIYAYMYIMNVQFVDELPQLILCFVAAFSFYFMDRLS